MWDDRVKINLPGCRAAEADAIQKYTVPFFREFMAKHERGVRNYARTTNAGIHGVLRNGIEIMDSLDVVFPARRGQRA